MPILDKQLMFSEAQALTTTAASTNVIDLGLGDLGNSPMEVLVKVDVAVTRAAGTSNITIALQTDSTAAFSSATTLASVTLAKTVMLINTEHFKVKVPVGAERFIRLNYTFDDDPDTATLTAGLLQGGARQTNDNSLDIL